MKIGIGFKIKFHYISDLAGQMLEGDGIVTGDHNDLKKQWPDECDEISVGNYLVKRKDVYGNTYSHLVSEDEIIEIIKGG